MYAVYVCLYIYALSTGVVYENIRFRLFELTTLNESSSRCNVVKTGTAVV